VFTGLVEALGVVSAQSFSSTGRSAVLEVVPENLNYCEEFKAGDSVAVNGCCLTLAGAPAGKLRFDVSAETLKLTNLGALKPGARVNLEGAMRLGERLGGHIVTGHIDGLAALVDLNKAADGSVLSVLVPSHLSAYLILKGSACIDGVSLTINQLTDGPDGCLAKFMIIPTTLEKTTFAAVPPGWRFNLEVDIVGKYIERLKFDPKY